MRYGLVMYQQKETMRPRIITASLILAALATSALADDKPKKLTPTFQKDVLPLLKQKCNRCHGAKRKGGKLDLRT